MAKKKTQTFKLPANLLKILAVLGILSVISLLLAAAGWYYLQDKIYPGIFIAQTHLLGQTPQQAQQQLDSLFQKRLSQTLEFKYQDASSSATFSLDLSKTQTNTSELIAQAFDLGHNKFYQPPVHLLVNLNYDSSEQQLEAISKEIDKQALDSQIKVIDSSIQVSPSQEGLILDKEQLKKILTDYINTGKLTTTLLPLKKTSPRLSYQTALKIKKRLDAIRLTPLKLIFKDYQFTLSLDQILTLIDLENTQNYLAEGKILNNYVSLTSISIGEQELTDTKLVLKEDQIKNYLKELSQEIDRPMREPLFSFDGVRVTEFQPPQEGYKLDIEAASQEIASSLLSKDQTTIKLPVEITSPKNKLTNQLGIKELLGRGISHFTGSIPNRIFNISHTASKINGVLIPPGEVFSFNNTVGDISAATGYKQAYVIKSGRTVLDDGGGVCQDSTTLFRAVLNAGLPVLKRTAHAYRVGYYEQGFPPGLDATVYAPSVDFQFKNDTGAHILIQAYTAGNSLYVDLYGTSDGRVAKISTPIVANQTPPPPDLRQDDPTLPAGTIKQVDFSAWGANVIFTRTVTRASETLINETFRSNFRPWQAIFLVGTGG